MRLIDIDIDCPNCGCKIHIEPDWEEMLVIFDNCGHAIRVKRLERRTDEAN